VAANPFVSQILALVENISFWRRLEAKAGAKTDDLRRSEARFRSLVQHASDVITVIDARGKVGYQSPSTFAVFGYEPDEIEGRIRTDLIHDADITRATAAAEELFKSPGSTVSVEGRIRSRTGGWRHVEAIATNLLHDPAVEGLVVNTRDITERKQLEEALTFRAFHDPLTNLPNRALFADRLAHALQRSARRADSIAVLFLDLDEFKNVNDSLGHGRGDELLAAVGARLLNCMRDTDTVARLGGDEFAILIEDVDDAAGAASMAKRILAALETSLQVGEQQVIARASMGIAVSPEAGTTAEELLRAADVAMYAAKANGRGRFEFFERSMRVALLERMELETDLRDAVDRDQLFLEYQPIVSLDQETIRGTEALVRWRHPKHGVLPPGSFIGLAEERGIMGSIGSWVLRTACAQASEWRRRFPRGAPPRMVVNLSTTQLEHPGLVEDVELALLESGLDPESLVLELTESVVLESETAIAKLGQLREWGVRVSIDDFGTGYSSLSYLRRLPLDILKIDRSFIDGLDQVAHQSAIVEAILVMCSRLGIEPVAEGVEREAEAKELRRLHCGLAQGFYFERPISPERIAELLALPPGAVDLGSPGPNRARILGSSPARTSRSGGRPSARAG
jgi:diguanylate cyclase (GGDEF)-like protein/PAS domain S-box-containing protein